MPVSNEKADMRRRMSALRSSLTISEHLEKSRTICDQLESLLLHDDPASPLTVAAYMPFRDEVDVVPFLERCWERNVRVAIPRTMSNRQMSFFFIEGMQDVAKEKGTYGIRVPRPGVQEFTVSAQQRMVILVPGLAYDARLARLGYGAGYYDRWIARHLSSTDQAWLISPAFELQMVDELPVEDHDMRVDTIVTERRMLGTT